MKNGIGVRDRIIDTARRLFYEQGFQATGINQIIEEADIAKSSLYQHFKSKDELLITYLKLYEEEWFNGLYELTEKKADPISKITSLFDYRIKIAEGKTLKGCAFVRLAYELPNLSGTAVDIIRSYKKKVRLFIADAVNGIPQEKLSQNKEEIINSVYYLYEGCGIEATIFHSLAPINDAKKIAEKLLI